MSEYARTSNNLPTVLNPVIYFRVSAWTLAAVALLGTILNIAGDGQQLSFGNTFLTFTWSHNVVHFVLAAAAFLFGYAALPGSTVKLFAVIFGCVYVALGVAGFFTLRAGAPDHDTFLALTPTLNLIHLLLGGYALSGGLAAKYA